MTDPKLLYHTIRHLKPVQIYGRALMRLPRRGIAATPAPRLRASIGTWTPAIVRPATLVDRWRVRFLNEDGEIALPEQWNDPAKEKLWLYNLHYFDDLAADSDEAHRKMQRELVARWIAENPPGIGNGWEPYPLSLRIANWVKWALAGEPLTPEWRDSLAMQVRHLRQHLEWHLLGNHLAANAKALVLAGLYFDGAEADGWLEKGLAIYARELPEQVLADGAHFELSPMYHATILEDLLDILNAARCYDRTACPLLCDLPEITQRMRRWLQAMTHPDGGPAFFNDAAFAIAPSHAELEAYASRLGCPPLQPVAEGVVHLAASGYVRVARGDLVAFLDLAAVGPDYIPGHAHADTLSFELSLGRERIIVNSGTSTYASGRLRAAQRATAAHSTVTIGDANSSEVWASFRVGRRARVSGVSVGMDGGDIVVTGSHDGYSRLPGRPCHRRTWRFSAGALSVVDEIEGGAGHCATARLHLGAAVTAVAEASGHAGVAVTAAGRRIAWRSDATARIETGHWYPEFGKSMPNRAIVAEFDTGRLMMSIHWSDGDQV